VVVLKGYPRLSETFIAQEIRGLEIAGIDLVIVALRRPTDRKRHPVHEEIKAPVLYLPEYLHDDPLRVLGAILKLLRKNGFWSALRAFARDLPHDPTRHRLRRLGQAAVLAAEWPEGAGWLHAHFIHTPASVAFYASLILHVPWSCSAHAKDIWTSSDRDLALKLASAQFVVTCTKAGRERLAGLAPGSSNPVLSYHGIDLARFPNFARVLSHRDGSSPQDPIVILSVGRAVEKKGYDVLLQALALLPRELSWLFVHIGGGEQLETLKALAVSLGIAQRIRWEGAQAQEAVLKSYRRSDIFALACKIARDGDRDGLPNVLVEASSQALVCVSTDVAGVTELISNEQNGLVVESENPQVFSEALRRLIVDPGLRRNLGEAAQRHAQQNFDHRNSIRQLVHLFRCHWRDTG
jgi:glycosyltransferase involved in cell wall biosynthesis